MTGPVPEARVVSDEELREILAMLWPSNRDRLVARLHRLARCVQGLLPLAGQVHDDLQALIGALGTYGWPVASRLVAAVQHDLLAGRDATRYLAPIERLVSELLAAPVPERPSI